MMQFHPEVLNILTSIAPLAIFTHSLLTTRRDYPSHSHQLMSTAVHVACIVCQMCSFIYHAFNSISSKAARVLYCLDLVGVCCMSLGSPWLYITAIGVQGLGIYTTVLFTCMAWCLWCLAQCVLRDKRETPERWIMVLSAIGNYPALTRRTTAVASVTILIGYVLFYRLRFPERFIPATRGRISVSHALWHCAVFIGQLGFISSTYTEP